MKPEYQKWIDAFLAANNPYGKCKEACQEMMVAFPELKLVPGHIYDAGIGKRSHHWCVAEDGTIVDPTATQFPLLSEYEPWKPGDEVRAGKCMNCGDEIWRECQDLANPPKRECICSPICEEDFRKHLEGEQATP